MVLGTQPETREVYFYRQSYEQHTQTVRMYNKYTEILLAIEQMEEALPHSLRVCVFMCEPSNTKRSPARPVALIYPRIMEYTWAYYVLQRILYIMPSITQLCVFESIWWQGEKCKFMKIY